MRLRLPEFLADDRERAAAESLTAEDLAELIGLLRDGDAMAAEPLLAGTRHLIYRYAGEDDELIGPLWVALHDALARLRRNDLSTHEGYLCAALYWARKAYRMGLRRHIYPSSSTQATRKHRKQAIHPTLKCKGGTTMLRMWNQNETAPHAPQYDWLELLDTYAKTEMERDAIILLVEGFPIRNIAAVLGTTKWRVEQMVEAFRRRAELANQPVAA